MRCLQSPSSEELEGLLELNPPWLHSWMGIFKKPSRWSKACWEGRGAQRAPAGQECRLHTGQINSYNMHCVQ